MSFCAWLLCRIEREEMVNRHILGATVPQCAQQQLQSLESASVRVTQHQSELLDGHKSHECLLSQCLT